MDFNSDMLISRSGVLCFDEKDGELLIGLLESGDIGTVDLQVGYDFYKWEYV